MSNDEEKPQRMRHGARALAYALSLPYLQSVARKHGYALAIHGSMATDFDLVAIPWVDEAVDAEILIEALREGINGVIRDEGPDRNPTPKPHGRRAWSIYPDGTSLYLDVSVMPRKQDA